MAPRQKIGIQARNMETAGTLAWVEGARAAARLLQVQHSVRPPLAMSDDFPLVPTEPGGFRGLADTQDLETLHEKGLIIDIYL
ncbi:MAG: hypothetical protein V1816_08815 [Pseudomonadota bacterium]